MVQTGLDWRAVWARNERIAVQASMENLRRLWWLACLLVPLSLVHVTVSWIDTAPRAMLAAASAREGGSAAQAVTAASASPPGLAVTRWKEAVVIVHLGMAANLVVLGALVWWIRRQPAAAPAFRSALEAWGLISALGFAIVVAGIDQWVSSSITPFLIGCVLVGSLFLLRPQRAVPLYLCAFGAFAWALGLTQGDDTQLLSNRVDGLIAAALGFMVSLMIWRKHVLKETLVLELLASRQSLKEQGVDLQAMAVRDTLTDVWNRAEIMRLAQRELTRAQRHGGGTCFIVIDLDSFKQINDRWGHATGDRVLVAVAKLLLEELRATDEIGRLAGAEFAVLLPQTGLEEARQLAERLHLAIGRLRVPLGDAAVRLTASLGASSQTGRALVPVPQQFDRLYASAEQALASAKSQGRDRVVVAPMASLV